MLTTASKEEAGNGIDCASPQTNASREPSMPVAQVYRFWGEVQPRHRSWLQVAA